MKMNNNKNRDAEKIDVFTTIIPFAIILILCLFFLFAPKESTDILDVIRDFLGDSLGLYYLVIGLGVFLVSLYIAFSDWGNIILGDKDEQPKYSFLQWGAMMFTAGLAADILFYSFCEWIFYAEEPHVADLGSIQDWASTFTLFHWGPVPWSFYATLSVCFGFMLHVRKCHKQKYSEACRPILGKYTDKWPGKLIDILAVVALIAGTATTFSAATPLLSNSITELAGIKESKAITIVILMVVCVLYTISVMNGMKGIKFFSKICMYLFSLLLIYVLVFGGHAVYILETGFSALGNMIQNFIGLCTWTDAMRTSGFPQNWTIFYWAYWMVWCVASPFFMGNISKGRTVRQVIIGTYVFGVSSTLISFVILGNYGLGLQMFGELDVVSLYRQCGDVYSVIISIIKTLPCYKFVLIVLILSMIAFYSTSFDSITLVATAYSYNKLDSDAEADNRIKLFWAILLIMLPIALIFSESSMKNMQTVSIIAAYPIGMVMILIIASFFTDAKKYKSSK